MNSAYQLLGVGLDATRDDLKAAYRAKWAAYDPARVATMGPELAQVAAQRRAELTAAYRELAPALAEPPRLAPDVERRRDRQTIWALLILLAIALVMPLVRNVAVPERSVPVTGADTAALAAQAAPDFTLESLDGKRISLSQYRGQVVLVNVWTTWCPACVRETPTLVSVYNKFRAQGFTLLSVNDTSQDDPAKVAAFARNQGITFPIVLDKTSSVGQLYGTRLIPTSYLINQDGKIVYTHVGELDEAQISEQITALLKTAGGK